MMLQNFFLLEAGDTMHHFYLDIFKKVRPEWISHLNLQMPLNLPTKVRGQKLNPCWLQNLVYFSLEWMEL